MTKDGPFFRLRPRRRKRGIGEGGKVLRQREEGLSAL
jgi:hypothetical protein